MKVPDTIGVPLMVIKSLAHVAETPAGKPFAPETPLFTMPVAVVVANVILVNGVLIHKVGLLDPAPEVLITPVSGVTVIIPVAGTIAQPNNGML